jgi:hypothetical protein
MIARARAEAEQADLCWACDGFVHRLASGTVEFQQGVVGGLVPVCDHHLEQRDWPAGAEEWMVEDITRLMADGN